MNPILLLPLATEMLRQALAVSMLINKAASENRELTADELLAIAGRDDMARNQLVTAIAAADAREAAK